MDKMNSIYARLKNANHPTGSMRRAGFLFTFEIDEYNVTPEQEKAIRGDAAIIVMDHAPAGWKNKPAPATVKLPDEKTVSKKKSDPFDHIPEAVDLGEPLPAAPRKGFSRVGKPEIIEKLQAKGLVAGTDFDESASKDSLLQLLETA